MTPWLREIAQIVVGSLKDPIQLRTLNKDRVPARQVRVDRTPGRAAEDALKEGGVILGGGGDAKRATAPPTMKVAPSDPHTETPVTLDVGQWRSDEPGDALMKVGEVGRVRIEELERAITVRMAPQLQFNGSLHVFWHAGRGRFASEDRRYFARPL